MRRVARPLWLVSLFSLVLTSAATAPSIQSASSKTPPLKAVPLFGHEYIDLKSWAERRNFHLVWDREEGEIQLTNRWAKLEFSVDSRRAVVNGISVWLSYAIAATKS